MSDSRSFAGETDTADRIFTAARHLFARNGYDGVSVRDICREAGCNANAVHYHFHSKPQLFEAILKELGDAMLASANRALQALPRDASDFRTRLEIFLEEALSAFLANRDLVAIAHIEFLRGGTHTTRELDPEVKGVLEEYPRFLIDYFTRARDAGFLRPEVDPEIVAQLIMKPAFMMALSCGAHKAAPERSIENPDYRAHWIEQNVNILLGGIL